jgi:hypothetical protein
MKRGIHFTVPLPSIDRKDTYTDTNRWENLRQYATEMGSSATIYIQSFIKTGSGTEKLMGKGKLQTHRQHGKRRSLLSFFFQNRESRPKMTSI